MNFDNFTESGFCSSQDEGSVIDRLAKTKTQATKFFNELNRHQVKNKMGTTGQCSGTFGNRKKLVHQPTLQQILLADKENQGRQFRQYSTLESFRLEKKKKSKIVPVKECEIQREEIRKPSLQVVANYNFFEAIKQMGLGLIETRRHRQRQSNESEQATVKPDQPNHGSGFTEKQFQDGTKFKGLCQNGVIIKGQLHFSNGFIYNGELFLDKFHGKGTLQLPKKQIIEGDWIDGEIAGKATIRYPKGQIYYGDLKHFRRHGKGHLFFNDGSKYEGEFSEGELTGYGTHITATGEKTMGYWFYGDFVGTNEQVFENIIANGAAHDNKKNQKLIRTNTPRTTKKTEISFQQYMTFKQQD